MEPVVSVVMPARNVAGFIEESIRSVRRQTLPDWELIVVDDGSTDATPEVVRGLLAQDPRIRYVRQDNRGIAAVRNRGMALARSELLAFLDSDDLWDARFLERTVAVHRQRTLDAVCAYSNRLLPDGQLWEYPFEKKERSGTILVPWIRREIVIHINAMLLRMRTLAERGLGFTEGCHNGEDTEFKCKLFSVGNVHCLPEVLMTYRKRPGSITERAWDGTSFRHSTSAFARGVAFARERYRGDDRDVVVAECERQLHLRRYEASYRMIKTGRFDDLKAFLEDPVWLESLGHFRRGEFGFARRWRAHLILSKQEWLWRLKGRRGAASA